MRRLLISFREEKDEIYYEEGMLGKFNRRNISKKKKIDEETAINVIEFL